MFQGGVFVTAIRRQGQGAAQALFQVLRQHVALS